MPSIDITGAAARLHAFGTNTPSSCLEYVWQAISQGQVHYLVGGAQSAYATWQTTDPTLRHLGDQNVPRDYPAFFGPKPGNDKGDVILSNGDGTFTATDYPSGHVGICTLAQRAAEIGRPYLGWSETMGGYNLTDMATAGLGRTLIIPVIEQPKEDDMKLITHPNGSMAEVGPASFEIISPYTRDSIVPIYGAGIPVSEAAWTWEANRVAKFLAARAVEAAQPAVTPIALSDSDIARIVASLKAAAPATPAPVALKDLAAAVATATLDAEAQRLVA